MYLKFDNQEDRDAAEATITDNMNLSPSMVTKCYDCNTPSPYLIKPDDIDLLAGVTGYTEVDELP